MIPASSAGHVSTSALVAALGVTEDTAVLIRLCWMPRHAGDLRQIAERFGVDVDTLTAALSA
jgi:hypothetical protein